MGQELTCQVQFAGKRSQGKAQLETKEILFRGDFRLKIPFASIKAVKAKDGELRIKTAEGLAVLALGSKAETWRSKILNPKSLIEKLGVRLGDAVALHGAFEKSFREDLKKIEAKITSAPGSTWVFLAAQSCDDLTKVKSIAKSLQGAAALWVIYPKGQKKITEHDVRIAGLKVGLVDMKVASFSDTRTALKFVIPKAKR